MLISFFLLVYAFVFSYLSGSIFLHFISRYFNFENKNISAGLVCIIGLAILSPDIALYHFFFAIDGVLHLILWIAIATYFLLNKSLLHEILTKLKSYSLKNILVFALLLLAAILSIIARPGSGDIADYHLQAIKWAEHYKNILGLGNFNRPLANNNWWFNLQAFFGLGFLGIQSVYVLNGLFFICSFMYFFKSENSPFIKTFRIPILIFISLSLKTAFVGSVTPDFIITLLVFLCFDIFLQSQKKNATIEFYFLLLLMLITWAISIKIISVVLCLLLLPLAIKFYKSKNYSFTVVSVAVAFTFFILPWVIGNVIACGYLVYPVNAIDLFDIDWKVPAAFFEYDKLVLKSWGKIANQDVFITAKLNLGEWLPVWFNKLDLFNKSLALTFVSFIPILFLGFLKDRKNVWPSFVALLAFILLFLNGPHVRFLFGYMVVIISFSIAAFHERFKFNIQRKYFLAVVFAFSILLIYKNQKQNKLLSSFIKPIDYPKEILNEKLINGEKFFIAPSNNQCWDCFPCSYYFINNVAMRGNKINDGFRIPK